MVSIPFVAEADVAFSDLQPPDGTTVSSGTKLPVYVRIASEYLLNRVVASIGTTSVVMACNNTLVCGASLPLDDVASGSITLTFSATDATNATASATASLVLDRPPVITLEHDYRIHPEVGSARIMATCADDFGCTDFSLQAVGRSGVQRTLASGASSTIDVTLPVEADQADHVTLTFTAADKLGSSRTSVQSDIAIQPSSYATVRDRVPGVVLDADATRVAYRATDGALVVRDRTTTMERTLLAASDPDGDVSQAFLTRFGALFAVGGDSLAMNPVVIKEDHEGTVYERARRTDPTPTTHGIDNVAGDWAAFAGRGRNLATGEEPSAIVRAVGSDGSLFYVPGSSNAQGCGFGLRKGEQTISLGTAPSYVGTCVSVVSVISIDGSGAAWVQLKSPVGPPGSSSGVFVYEGAGAVRLMDGFTADTALPVKLAVYRNSGWTAFSSVSNAGTLYVQRRTPQGGLDAPAPFSDLSTPMGISASGELWLRREAANGKAKIVYRAPVGGPLSMAAAGDGTLRELDGDPLYFFGDAVFALGPVTNDPDAGVDAGIADTGSSPDAAGLPLADAGGEELLDAAPGQTVDARSPSLDGGMSMVADTSSPSSHDDSGCSIGRSTQRGRRDLSLLVIALVQLIHRRLFRRVKALRVVR